MEERVRWLDCAKGLGILLVVLGHSIPGVIKDHSETSFIISSFIYYFHMPFFIFLSGYGFRLAQSRYASEGIRPFLLRKIKGYLVPYFVYSTVVYVLAMAANRVESLRPVLEAGGYGPIPLISWITGVLTGSNEYCQHMWYLYAVFAYAVICRLIVRIAGDNRKRQYLLAAAAICISLYLAYVPVKAGRIGTYSCVFYLYWFVMGWKLPVRRIRGRYAVVLLGICTALFGVFYCFGSIYQDSFAGFAVHTLIKYVMIVCLISLVMELRGRAEKYALFLGTHSMEIYLFSQPFFGAAWGSILYRTGVIPIPIIVISSLIVSIVIPVAVCRLFFKRFAVTRFLFGLPEDRNRNNNTGEKVKQYDK